MSIKIFRCGSEIWMCDASYLTQKWYEYLRRSHYFRITMEVVTVQTATSICAVEQYEMLARVPSEPYVMVVDDDASILSVVTFLLDTENLPHMSFSDSANVIPFLEKIYVLGIRLPSLLLLDLMMPALSGYEIAASLAQSTQLSNIPILIMTADHRIKEVRSVPGAHDLINKPFHIDVLLDKIEHFLAQ